MREVANKQETQIDMNGRRYRGFDDDDADGQWDGESRDVQNEDESEESLDDVLASARELTDDSTEISMEVDENGNEVWYAEDPKIPGSSSLGNSLEEAMEGMVDRRREFRELLSRRRKGKGKPGSGQDVSSELDRARKEYREKLKRSRKKKPS